MPGSVVEGDSQPATSVNNGDKLPSLSEVRSSIPPECFEKKPLLSLYYLVKDLTILGLLYYFYESLTSTWLTWFLWVNVVGFFGWALFVVGHDCGHGSFSDSYLLNQICGHIAHTPLLVPFNGWRVSHHLHHLNHNHTENDHGWKMVSKGYYDSMLVPGIEGFGSLLRFTPIVQLFMFHWYLIGLPDNNPGLSGSHFSPYSKLFSTNAQRFEAALSTTMIFAWLFFLLKTFSFTGVMLYYIPPVLICSAWLSLVTLLHHTHPDSKYYDDKTWSYYQGALTTIDRSYGSIIDSLHHNIETHVVHHLFFTTIPHYHLKRATEVVRPLLGSHFQYDTTPFWKSYLIAAKNCLYTTEVNSDGVYQYPRVKSQ